MLKLNIVAFAVTLGRREFKTLRSVLVVDAGLTDRQECLRRGVGEMSEGDPGGGRKERNDNDNVINNVIITSTPTARLIVTFSIPPQFYELWQKFLKVAKREGGSRGRSQVILKALTEYTKRHALGNPDMLLTTYMAALAPGPLNVKCRYIRGARSDGLVLHEVFKDGAWQEEWIQGIRCYSCKYNKLKKGEKLK